MRPQVTTLTGEAARTAMEMCGRNAKSLTEEARLLAQANKLPRAFTLYHCAIEEFAKFLMIETALRKTLMSVHVNWHRFWKRLRSHDSKMAHISVRVYALDFQEPSDELEGARDALEVWWSAGLGPRNASIYVELDGSGRFRAPDEIDWLPGVTGLRTLASVLYRVCEGIGWSAEAVASSIERPSSFQPIRSLETVLLRLHAFGLNEAEAKAMLEDAWQLTCGTAVRGANGGK